MYRWRKISAEERAAVLAWRRERQHPPHSPFHWDSGRCHYLITAACFEHRPHVGHSVKRMSDFTGNWLDLLYRHCDRVVVWVMLPNHYHALVSASQVLPLLKELGRLHGRTSFDWNGEEFTRGRQVWCKASETVIKSTDHFNATINYVLHHPVKHRYVAKWTDWPWSGAHQYLDQVGHEEAERLWRAHPVDRYGAGWDDPEL